MIGNFKTIIRTTSFRVFVRKCSIRYVSFRCHGAFPFEVLLPLCRFDSDGATNRNPRTLNQKLSFSRVFKRTRGLANKIGSTQTFVSRQTRHFCTNQTKFKILRRPKVFRSRAMNGPLWNRTESFWDALYVRNKRHYRNR